MRPASQLTPDYPIGCKRVLFADDYYPALMRPNVSLVTDHIARIDSSGVVTGGRRQPSRRRSYLRDWFRDDGMALVGGYNRA